MTRHRGTHQDDIPSHVVFGFCRLCGFFRKFSGTGAATLGCHHSDRRGRYCPGSFRAVIYERPPTSHEQDGPVESARQDVCDECVRTVALIGHREGLGDSTNFNCISRHPELGTDCLLCRRGPAHHAAEDFVSLVVERRRTH